MKLTLEYAMFLQLEEMLLPKMLNQSNQSDACLKLHVNPQTTHLA